jgi:serine/threonine protein kinase
VAVALKLLRRFDGDAIYRFKREFRALADVVHPNLVQLYELVSTGEQWFFTMELVEGVDFLRFVRGEGRAESSLGSDEPTAPTAMTRAARARVPSPLGAANVERLRHALPGLAEGVRALHRAGHLHRDLKPSNVRVRPDGRVTVLDFGVITELAGRAIGADDIVGTPAYMAPEQSLAGTEPSEAQDWYSVGVVLFEALTGCRPFSGPAEAVLAAKRSEDALRPSSLCAGIPGDLDELCRDLLARDPAAHPGETHRGRRWRPGGLPGRLRGRGRWRRRDSATWRRSSGGSTASSRPSRARSAGVRGRSGSGRRRPGRAPTSSSSATTGSAARRRWCT